MTMSLCTEAVVGDAGLSGSNAARLLLDVIRESGSSTVVSVTESRLRGLLGSTRRRMGRLVPPGCRLLLRLRARSVP